VEAEGVLDNIDYEMYPWGNAYYNVSQCASTAFDKQKTFCWAELCGNKSNPPPGCFSGTVLCQHGQDECDADSYESCAKILYPKAQFTKFITCFEGENEARLNMASHCASVANMSYLKLQSCFYGDDRLKFDAEMAKATAALGKAKLGTPWVLLDGVRVQPDGMLKQVCAALVAEGTTPLPPGCQAQAAVEDVAPNVVERKVEPQSDSPAPRPRKLC